MSLIEFSLHKKITLYSGTMDSIKDTRPKSDNPQIKSLCHYIMAFFVGFLSLNLAWLCRCAIYKIGVMFNNSAMSVSASLYSGKQIQLKQIAGTKGGTSVLAFLGLFPLCVRRTVKAIKSCLLKAPTMY